MGGEQVEEKVEPSTGHILLGVVAQSGLETSVAGYLASFEDVLTAIVHAAEHLAEDGFSLEDFIALLKTGEVE